MGNISNLCLDCLGTEEEFNDLKSKNLHNIYHNNQDFNHNIKQPINKIDIESNAIESYLQNGIKMYSHSRVVSNELSM